MGRKDYLANHWKTMPSIIPTSQCTAVNHSIVYYEERTENRCTIVQLKRSNAAAHHSTLSAHCGLDSQMYSQSRGTLTYHLSDGLLIFSHYFPTKNRAGRGNTRGPECLLLSISNRNLWCISLPSFSSNFLPTHFLERGLLCLDQSLSLTSSFSGEFHAYLWHSQGLWLSDFQTRKLIYVSCILIISQLL